MAKSKHISEDQTLTMVRHAGCLLRNELKRVSADDAPAVRHALDYIDTIIERHGLESIKR